MALNQHKTDINLISSIDALAEILSESRVAAEPAFGERPMSTNDPVPDDPFWTPKNCYLYALNRFHKRWPKAEAIISSDPKAAVDYAVNVLDDVWPDDENGRHAEKMISRDPGRALWYAKMVKGRWEKIEPAMASKANWAYEYAKCVLEHQWDGPHAKDAEIAITSDPWTAMLYCVDLKYPKRYDNPRIERMILDSIYGALYAHTVTPKLTMKELNQEVDSRLEALNVGQNVDLSNVFEESYFKDPSGPEPDIKTSKPGVLVHYAEDIIKGRWPEAEPYILDKCLKCESRYDRDYLFSYALNVIMPYDKANPNYDRGRWIEAEPIIGLDPHTAYSYARIILKERWKNPDIELNILDCTQSAKYYAEYVAKTSEDELREDVESKIKDMHRHDDIDLSGTTEEAIVRLKPLITENKKKPEPDLSKMTLPEIYSLIFYKNKNRGIRFPEAESYLMKDPRYAYYYTCDVINKGKKRGIRWPEAEPYIMKSPEYAVNYTRDVINKSQNLGIRWPKAEPYIMKSPEYARDYTYQVINKSQNLGKRWPEAEPYIKRSPEYACIYTETIINKYDHLGIRWPEAEPYIIRDKRWAERYARFTAQMPYEKFKSEVEAMQRDLHPQDYKDLSGTTEEAIDRLLPLIVEAIVERDYSTMTPATVYTYTITDYKTKQLRGEDYEPDPKAEAVMIKDPGAAYYYARDVINDGKCLGKRWKEAEPVIMSEPYWAYAYAKDALGRRWRDAEHVIKSDTYIAYLYARYIIKPSDYSEYDYDKGRWDLETESRILEDHGAVLPENDSEKESEICELYANNVAEMSIDELKADVERKISGMRFSDEIDLSGTTEEGLKNTTSMIVESREDEIRAMALFHKALDKKLVKEEGLTPEQESQILKSPEYAYKYAKYVLDGQWAEAEPILLTNLYWAFYYAQNVIEGRWEAAEPLILGGKNLEFALPYATDISKIRLDPMVELRIIEHFEENDDDGYHLDDYCTQVAKMSVEDLKADAEMKISELTSGDDIDLSDTTEEAIDRLLPLITEGKKKPEPDPSKMTLEEIYRYAYKRRRLDKRWPEAEPYIMKYS